MPVSATTGIPDYSYSSQGSNQASSFAQAAQLQPIDRGIGLAQQPGTPPAGQAYVGPAVLGQAAANSVYDPNNLAAQDPYDSYLPDPYASYLGAPAYANTGIASSVNGPLTAPTTSLTQGPSPSRAQLESQITALWNQFDEVVNYTDSAMREAQSSGNMSAVHTISKVAQQEAGQITDAILSVSSQLANLG